MAVYNQDSYIESAKGTLIEFIKSVVGTEADVSIAFPDITGATFSLAKPLIYVEFERELNLDSFRGRRNGAGKQTKRKMLTYSFQVITTGNNAAVMARDRIVQKLVSQTLKQYELLSGKGLRKAEAKYVGSYRVREGVHLARLEFYSEIKFTN